MQQKSTIRSWYRKHRIAVAILLCSTTCAVAADTTAGWNLMVAPGTVAAHSVTLLWDKQYQNHPVVYEVLLNGHVVDSTQRTDYTLMELDAARTYSVRVRTRQTAGYSNTISFTTVPEGKMVNILDFGASKNSGVLNSVAIQKTIDACPEGGTVYVPPGEYLTGALFLKSNMTLRIDEGAILLGSENPDDYLPMIRNRFEGWEMDTYASLLNAGTMDNNGPPALTHLRITGGGTIRGGGKILADRMVSANGNRSRGRLICLMNCSDVSIDHLTLTQPPSWTLHYIYSRNTSCFDLNIQTVGIHNGDGIDPDSSTDSFIFNCRFETGDDCIAIKSGKNPEGFFIAKPSRNIRVTYCDFVRGHGISIGSEMSGGVSDILIRDCSAGALLHGMQIKGTKDRGGYVRNVTVEDCLLRQITIFSSVNYNNDGDPAPETPVFSGFVFKNLDLSAASIQQPVIDVNGYEEPGHKLRDVVFENITLPDRAIVTLTNAREVTFSKVRTVGGAGPEFRTKNCVNIKGVDQ